MLLPPLALLADDMMGELVSRRRLGITDAVYKWNAKREKDNVGGAPLVTDLVIDSDVYYKKLVLGELLTLAALFDDREVMKQFGEQLVDALENNARV